MTLHTGNVGQPAALHIVTVNTIPTSDETILTSRVPSGNHVLRVLLLLIATALRIIGCDVAVAPDY